MWSKPFPFLLLVASSQAQVYPDCSADPAAMVGSDPGIRKRTDPVFQQDPDPGSVSTKAKIIINASFLFFIFYNHYSNLFIKN